MSLAPLDSESISMTKYSNAGNACRPGGFRLCRNPLQRNQLIFPVAKANGFGVGDLTAPVGCGMNVGEMVMVYVIALAERA